MKMFMLFLVLIGLGGCDWYRNAGYARDAEQRSYERRQNDARLARQRAEQDRQRIAAMKRDNHLSYADEIPPPDGWLSLDFACSGALRRAQWLVCEHEELGQLHRRLALQWEAAYRSASPERLSVLSAQQNAFVGERNACEDVGCVAAAYHRYLDGYQKQAAPWYPPAKRWQHEPWRQRHNHGRAGIKVIVERDGDRGYRSHDRFTPGIPISRSCLSEIGFASAQRLGEKCDAVTPGLSSLCSVHNSCGGIRVQIDRGCGLSSDKPDFCRHY